MHANMKQQVTQLLAESEGVAAVYGVYYLIGLFYKAGAQRFVGLLCVPWTAAWGAKPAQHRHEAVHIAAIKLVLRHGGRHYAAGGGGIAILPVQLKQGNLFCAVFAISHHIAEVHVVLIGVIIEQRQLYVACAEPGIHLLYTEGQEGVYGIGKIVGGAYHAPVG